MIYSVAKQEDLMGVSFCCGQEFIDNYFANKMLKDDDAVSFYKRHGLQDFVSIMTQPSNMFIEGCVPMFLNL